jgi:hypothetical protein
MRSGLIGFVAGAFVVGLGFLTFQHWVIKDAAHDFNYHFIRYVFSDTQFPWSYLEQGRVITRCLYPVKITTTYYDAKYNEVTQADKPGRYGAVVRMALAGGVVEYRFITLYRTPEKIFWSDGATPATVSAQFPPGLGIDPVVLQKQGVEIGNSINNDFFGDGDVSPALAIILAGLSETSPDDPPAVARTSVEARDDNWWFGLRQHLGLVAPYSYLVDLPQGYEADPAERWPLILYLHGGAQFGYDLQLVRESGLAGRIARGKQLPAVVVSPQCPVGSWNIRILALLLDQVCAKYRIDPDRIYVTGISAGGDATFDFATAYPERIAAIAPIAGDGDPADAARLKNIPVWDFQGLKDDIAPPENPIAVVKAVRQAGGHAHQTLFPDAGHYDSWGLGYGTEALYPWLLAQKRGQPEVLTPGVPTP